MARERLVYYILSTILHCDIADGQPKMLCARELIVWIAAEFEWENLGSKALEQIIIDNTNSNSRNTSSKDLPWITRFDMRLTLTKRRVPLPNDPENVRKLNEYWLKEDAFAPKTYTVHLEKGVFLTPDVAKDAKNFPDTQRYTLRLVFDTSPYPPPQQWRDPYSYATSLKTQEWTELYARPLPGVYKHSLWSDCIVV